MLLEILRFAQDDKLGFVGVINGTGKMQCVRRGRRLGAPIVGVGEIPLLGEMSRSDKGVMAQP